MAYRAAGGEYVVAVTEVDGCDFTDCHRTHHLTSVDTRTLRTLINHPTLCHTVHLGVVDAVVHCPA